jgi:TatD DNase family protein
MSAVIPWLTDTHCHLTHSRYDRDRAQVITRAQDAGVTHFLVPGLNVVSSREAVRLAESTEGVFAAVGVHPHEAKTWNQVLGNELRELARSPHVVAIGEIGLDYYRNLSPPEQQRDAFRAQLDIALEFHLPVVIHNREATDDIMELVLSWSKQLPHQLIDRAGVLHAFSADLTHAHKVIEAGFYLGVAGQITYPKSERRRKIIADIPLERLLIETDSPYLTPHPDRNKRNEPAHVKRINDQLAVVKKIESLKAAEITSYNASSLFGWNHGDEDDHIL